MRAREVLNWLRRYESRNVTFQEPDGSWPIVWERARGTRVWDAEGRAYLDLTAAFGVAAAGHAHPAVVRAAQRQAARLPHAMGDVHPHPLKARLARELSRLTFERWSPRATGKSILCQSGFEAVEAALKTALLATGRREILAFEGGYHGLGYGALNATHRRYFRQPFLGQLGGFARFAPYPCGPAELAGALRAIAARLSTGRCGAVLVEPVQARGGIRLPPSDFLPALRELCSRHGALLILDEIYTGFGRTGRWFACEHGAVTPDLICLGKALAGGFPLSACVGRADLMDAAWPSSTGEALHTSTFLGHPVGCAAALAQIGTLRRLGLIRRSRDLGRQLLGDLAELAARPCRFHLEARGLGLMAGLELRRPGGAPATAEALRIVKAMLHRGFILLPEGEHSNVISFTPPLTITAGALRQTVRALGELLPPP